MLPREQDIRQGREGEKVGTVLGTRGGCFWLHGRTIPPPEAAAPGDGSRCSKMEGSAKGRELEVARAGDPALSTHRDGARWREQWVCPVRGTEEVRAWVCCGGPRAEPLLPAGGRAPFPAGSLEQVTGSQVPQPAARNRKRPGSSWRLLLFIFCVSKASDVLIPYAYAL